VASSPAGLSCGASCTASFPYGSTVTLTATPSARQHFTGWTGACSGMGACTIALGVDPVAVGAGFAVDTYTLTVAGGVGGGVTSSPAGVSCSSGSCSASFSSGQVVTLAAQPAAGYRFGAWGGDCSGAGACAVAMDQARAVSASFVAVADLTV